ncbi:MAG: hypothetical protein IKJ55_01115 [Clostridia bacterium]|nr:hypothetical protein [Clostridia bacterium]
MKKRQYVDIIEKVFSAYTPEHIRAYTAQVKEKGIEEHGYPRVVANLGFLLAHGKMQEMKDEFVGMMDLCCAELPVCLGKNGGRTGNDFSVKEITITLLELEKAKIFPESDTKRWRAELAKIDPYSTYKDIASVPPVRIGNWAAFGAASEQLRKFAGIGDESAFIDNQIASQLLSFDPNGMYRDPREPMVYDAVTRLQLAAALFFGFDGAHAKKLEKQLAKSADLTLKLQSVTGEIPYGGRSNQFLHNETFFAALCEFYATYFKKKGDLSKAGQFKRAAKLAIDNVKMWLAETPIHHVKNFFDTETKFGCEEYAYFDKYMVTAGSWAILAYCFADDAVKEEKCPAENENYAWETSKYFHRAFAKFGSYLVQGDTDGDGWYDASGIGRIHKKGIPSALCLTVPMNLQEVAHYHIDIKNPSKFSICGGIKTKKGFVYGYQDETKHSFKDVVSTDTYSAFTMHCKAAEKEYDLICKVTKNGVEFTAEGKGELEILLPLFWFDGKTYTEIWGTNNKAEVLYKGCVLTYSSRNKMEMTENMYANRSGYYKSAKVSGKNKVTVKIKMKRVKNNG